MVDEYADRNTLRCRPATRRRQRHIHRTLRKIDTMTPSDGQTRRDVTATKIELRNHVMLPVLGKLSALYEHTQGNEHPNGVHSDPGAVRTPAASTLPPTSANSAATTVSKHDPYHFTGVYARGHMSDRSLKTPSQGHGYTRRHRLSPRQVVPPIKRKSDAFR